jgi:hypothetical protein
MERTEFDRMRKNEETFAQANEKIRNAAERLDVDPVPFFCECSALDCTDLIHMTLDTYRKVRESDGFMICPGHDDPHVEAVVEDHGAYQVVEKFR